MTGTRTEYYRDEQVTLLLGDALEQLRTLPDASVDCCITSPPYLGLRDYGIEGQYGLEETPAEYVETMRAVFAEVRRVLVNDGTCWINLGDSYATQRSWDGSSGRSDKLGAADRKSISRPMNAKNLLGIPWRVAFVLQDDGWILRNDIIWHKPNAIPESVTDRLSGRHELLFMFSRSLRYWFDIDAIRVPHTQQSAASCERRAKANGIYRENVPGQQPHTLTSAFNSRGANPGDVWSIPTRPYPEAHFATFPIDLPLRCIKAGCKPSGVVLDPFSGSGTTGEAARMLGRRYIGIDLNPAYHDLAIKRFAQAVIDFDEVGQP